MKAKLDEDEVKPEGGDLRPWEGSLCGTWESVEKVLAFIQSDDRLKGLRRIESHVNPEEKAVDHTNYGHSANSPLAAGKDAPFQWDHVKKEIVTIEMLRYHLLKWLENIFAQRNGIL